MQKAMKTIKTWCKNNFLVLLYFAFAVLMELVAVWVVEGVPFLSRPFLALGALLAVCGALLLISSNKARAIVSFLLLLTQAVLDLVFAVIFDMTDQYFDMGMLSLRNDAFAILESIPVNFVVFYAGFLTCVLLLVFGLRYAHNRPRLYEKKKSVFFYVGLILAGIATTGISFVCYFPRTAQDKYKEMVEGNANSAYGAYGMMGNLLGETGNLIFQDRTPLPDDELDTFFYDPQSVSTPTDYFGIAKDKNVVMILCESLEWYAFLSGDSKAGVNEGEYVNALGIPNEDLERLYPKLHQYYRESAVMSNFHSREKTDMAETLSVVGNYPTGAYVNYDYPDNTLPYTLPNMIKAESPELSSFSFHNGFKTFYNRDEAHQMFGFEMLYDMYDMDNLSNERKAELGRDTFRNYMEDGERNLDSEMIETMQDVMFPANKRFFTYITTITMHGMYYDRANMQPENNTKLAEQIELLKRYEPDKKTTENYDSAIALYYYMTTALELDYMLGCLDEALTERGVYDDTVVVLFGDHNAYYQGMSGYVKDIDGYDTDRKYTDLYNVPFMIRDADLAQALGEENRVVNKFTCTADIVPTMLDLLGIKYYTNLYYGHSVFAEEESVLYSRAYGVFVSDGILRRSVKGKLYQYGGTTELGVAVKDRVAYFEEEGVRLVEKIKHCDYLFKQDHFGKNGNAEIYVGKIAQLNAWETT